LLLASHLLLVAHLLLMTHLLLVLVARVTRKADLSWSVRDECADKYTSQGDAANTDSCHYDLSTHPGSAPECAVSILPRSHEDPFPI